MAMSLKQLLDLFQRFISFLFHPIGVRGATDAGKYVFMGHPSPIILRNAVYMRYDSQKQALNNGICYHRTSDELRQRLSLYRSRLDADVLISSHYRETDAKAAHAVEQVIIRKCVVMM